MRTDSVRVEQSAYTNCLSAQTYPALFNLYKLKLLPKSTSIIGYARTKMDLDTFHGKIGEHFKGADNEDGKKAKKGFLDICTYVPGAYDEDKAFQNLNSEMEKLESKQGKPDPNRLFYMALPPNVFTVVAAGLKKNCYSEKGHNRIVIEKPFGKDLESSREMMGKLKGLWKEEETFRIDHYLGKEMVKNLLVMRFGNPLIDASLNKDLVDNVQITFKEPFGTEGRGGYFDEFGIVRDIQQNRTLRWSPCSCLGGLACSLECSSQTCPRCFRSCRWSGQSRFQPRTFATKRSRCSRLCRRLRKRTFSLVSTRQQMASQATRTTTLFPRTATAPPLRPSRCGSRMRDGRASPSSSRRAKVRNGGRGLRRFLLLYSHACTGSSPGRGKGRGPCAVQRPAKDPV